MIQKSFNNNIIINDYKMLKYLHLLEENINSLLQLKKNIKINMN